MTDVYAVRPAPRASRLAAVGRAHYVAQAVLLTAIIAAGFWPFFAALPAGPRPWSPIIYVHAAVFLGWLGLFATQVTLVYRGRIRDHRALGRLGVAWGALVLLLGLVVSIVAPVAHVRAGEWSLDRAAGFLILPLGDMVLFPALFAAAIGYRHRGEVHKRLMLLAAIALVFPGAARAASPNMPLVLAIWLLPLGLAVAYDLLTRRRIHPANWLGTGLFLLFFGRVFLMEWEPWLAVGRGILRPFLPAA